MIITYPVCHRNREDCTPIHCIPAVPEGTSEDDFYEMKFVPLSFVCSGRSKDPIHEQDKYRLCFKNRDTDEMTDNDLQDITSIMVVASAALNLDAVHKVTHGVVEVPAYKDEL